MSQGIVVCSSLKTRDPLCNFLSSIIRVGSSGYPVFLTINGATRDQAVEFVDTLPREFFDVVMGWSHREVDGYEIGSIKMTLEDTSYEEFLLLHDTFEILDSEIFNMVFDQHPHVSVKFNEHMHSYAVKYLRAPLLTMALPDVSCKADAVRYEHEFNQNYAAIVAPIVLLFPGFKEFGNVEPKWGRMNRIIENKWIRKYKGTWDSKMISQAW